MDIDKVDDFIVKYLIYIKKKIKSILKNPIDTKFNVKII